MIGEQELKLSLLSMANGDTRRAQEMLEWLLGPKKEQVAEQKASTRQPLSLAEAAYGALWRFAEPGYGSARLALLERIGGKFSDGQRRAIEWACENFPPPDDFDPWQLDDAAFPVAQPTPEKGEGGPVIPEGFTKWEGGDRPVEGMVMVEAVFDGPWSSGRYSSPKKYFADDLNWTGIDLDQGDEVQLPVRAYRILPKEEKGEGETQEDRIAQTLAAQKDAAVRSGASARQRGVTYADNPNQMWSDQRSWWNIGWQAEDERIREADLDAAFNARPLAQADAAIQQSQSEIDEARS